MVMRTSSPPRSRKLIAASTLGPMEPRGNSPSSRYWRASDTVIRSSHRSSGCRKWTATRSTPVDRMSSGMPRLAASSADARSLSMTASTPW